MLTKCKLLCQKHFAVLLITLGIVGIGASAFLLLHKPTLSTIVADPSSVSVNAAPSSVKLSRQAVDSYSVPAANPRYIAIPAIGIPSTPIIKLGLLKSGAIATPNNIYETGWYDASSKPGQPGAMFIYGHVSSWQANGIFYDLKRLQPGDEITIIRGDNKTFTYEVVSSKVYDYKEVDMNAALSPIDPQKPGLNLMTCTGQIIKDTSEFNERLVVFTSLVSA